MKKIESLDRIEETKFEPGIFFCNLRILIVEFHFELTALYIIEISTR